jgi:hypothetical protein
VTENISEINRPHGHHSNKGQTHEDNKKMNMKKNNETITRLDVNMNENVKMKMSMKIDIKMNKKMKRNLDILIYSMMEPCDDRGAPMSNDCQACDCAQTHARQSISLEYLHKNKD